MPHHRPAVARPHEIIEILSGSESDDDDVMEVPRPGRLDPDLFPQPDEAIFANEAFDAEWAATIAALEADDDGPLPVLNQGPILVEEPQEAHAMTEDECLKRVLEIYPEISHDHVRDMFRAGLHVGMPADSSWCDQLIVRILDEGKYPTEREARRAALKRKREPSEERFDQPPLYNDPGPRRAYQAAACNTLHNEYPEVPVKFLEQTLRSEGGSLFKAFLLIDAAERSYSSADRLTRPYRRVRRRDPKPLDHLLQASEGEVRDAMDRIQKELSAAKKSVKKAATDREKEEDERLKEERNEQLARSTNAMKECGCCFTDYPLNRMVHCNTDDPHFFCYSCMQNWVGSEMGQGRCRPKCFTTDGCSDDFSRAQLQASLDPKILERLEKLQQLEDLRAANIDGLEQCPFCDYQEICDPVEVDREFRCGDCKVVSCRLCRHESHTPLTCEQATKDRKGNVRHEIEEHMTEALIRTCNKCKNRFIKESGCNKMICGTCGNAQCYICSANVRGYDHFHESRGKCPLHDNWEKRHQEEVGKAEADARAKIRAAHPDISEDDLKIQVSESVKQDEKKRVERMARYLPDHGGPVRGFDAVINAAAANPPAALGRRFGRPPDDQFRPLLLGYPPGPFAPPGVPAPGGAQQPQPGHAQNPVRHHHHHHHAALLNGLHEAHLGFQMAMQDYVPGLANQPGPIAHHMNPQVHAAQQPHGHRLRPDMYGHDGAPGQVPHLMRPLGLPQAFWQPGPPPPFPQPVRPAGPQPARQDDRQGNRRRGR